MTYRIMIIGSGGREHALAWALARTGEVSNRELIVVPGNGGTEWEAYRSNDGLHYAKTTNLDTPINDLTSKARELLAETDLVVVGPEVPLAAGIVDELQAFAPHPIPVFGPAKASAQLEASKAFSKDFMRENGIPTADFAVYEDYDAACAYVDAQMIPLVIKADGLAAGKGVIVCDTPSEAKEALQSILVDRVFGEAGNQVVIEARLTGWEVSVLAFVDGQHFAIMPYAADHKRVFDGDEGPNTGGMGAYAPRPIDYPNFDQLVIEQVIRPTVEGMAKRGIPYKGVLYCGLMITTDGLKVLEYNCRFGDPEAQVILPLLETDLAEIMIACIEGTLDQLQIRWRSQFCATVVLASGGYPNQYDIGLPIGINLPLPANTLLFHAGTRQESGGWLTTGGRVLNMMAVGDTLEQALERAYEATTHVYFEGMHYRKDIGRKAKEVV